ncbi:short chain dehydrogenase [Kordiimonas sediminis]|uniref:Short chain dehydrogenase n=1 Tax=Kordiimonas sediminis TaxID=1735581 RepID=A0A919E815_9PROT|nr:SDR family oxidoreductase [Kordiimonas sediminis]GHF23208.1 short chain dehydrogenase [Kordiimonas sediminis]
MAGSVQKHTALVTGGARRIGKAIALDLAKHGHNVIVHYHGSSAEADAVVKAITSEGGRATSISADLADPNAVASLIEKATSLAGRPITALINNASLFGHDTIDTFTHESWTEHMTVNTYAPLALSQTFYKALPQDAKGAIINMIDQRVWKLTPDFMTYTVSKAALWTLTQTLAQALAPAIRVNAIGPGPVLPSIHQKSGEFEVESANVPLQKGPELAEICNTVRFLLETPSMTGQMIALDGGQHLNWQTPDIC